MWHNDLVNGFQRSIVCSNMKNVTFLHMQSNAIFPFRVPLPPNQELRKGYNGSTCNESGFVVIKTQNSRTMVISFVDKSGKVRDNFTVPGMPEVISISSTKYRRKFS